MQPKTPPKVTPEDHGDVDSAVDWAIELSKESNTIFVKHQTIIRYIK